jgi:TatD DNase family protein
LVDSHCHLDARQFRTESTADILRRARAGGVTRCVTVGTDVNSSRRAVALAEDHPCLWATVGVSPNDLDDFDADSMEALRQLCRSDRVVAIGEIGLDYHWMRAPKELQHRAFRRQLDLAGELSLPVVVHVRDAHDDALAVLAAWAADLPFGGSARGGARGVMHCFSGNADTADAVVGLGFMVSFAGNVTYPTADRLRSVAATVDAAAFVLETDAPYLAPEGLRGTRNEPAAVRRVAETLADLRGKPLDELCQVTSANAARLFGWTPWPS